MTDDRHPGETIQAWRRRKEREKQEAHNSGDSLTAGLIGAAIGSALSSSSSSSNSSDWGSSSSSDSSSSFSGGGGDSGGGGSSDSF